MTIAITNLQSRTIEWLRYPLMVLIVVIHTDTALLGAMPVGDGLSPILYASLRTVIRVAVPLFFIFSGYWFFRLPERFSMDDYRIKLAKRVRSLLVPYLIWNFFAWALQLIVVVLQGHADWIPPTVFHPDRLLDIFVGMGDGYQGMPKAFQLWFLRDLIVLCLFSPALYLLLRGRHAWVLIIFAMLYLMPWPGDWPAVFMRFPSALLFFGIGAWFGLHKADMVDAARHVPLWLSLTVPSLLMAWHVWLTLHGSPTATSVAEKLFSIAATVPTLRCAAALVERRNLRPTRWLAGSAFLLFAIHPLIINYLLVEPLAGRLSPTVAHFWLVLCAEVALPMALCAAIHVVAIRFMPRTAALLTGGRAASNIKEKETTQQHHG